jgi:arylsulfatase A-like enzyme
MPSNLVAVADNSSLSLNWDASSEPDLDGYNIYRSIDGGDDVLIATLTTSSSGFVDYGFGTSQPHTYRVTAIDTSSNESEPGEYTVAAVTPPGTLDFSPTSGTNRPNIILVMADDQGWGDTGYNGHPFLLTPVLDEMAANGFVFNRFYAAAAVCSPTRASVMSGRNPMRSKVTNHGRYMRGHLEKALPATLKAAGYVTGMFGKWHIGSGQPNSPVNPSGLGFDEWVIGLNYFDNSPYLSRNGTIERRTGARGTAVTVTDTIAFLNAHKNSGKPMFAVVWFPSPHKPHDEVSDHPGRYTGDPDKGYFQEITLLDEQLGRLRDCLKNNGIEQNTLIWYCSDNGGLLSASSGGRGKKASTYEGGFRVPGIIEWPGRNLKGSSNVPVVTSDMYPTLLALTGSMVENPLPLDGIDIAEIIEGIQYSRSPIGFWQSFQGGQSTPSDTILSAIKVKQGNGDPLPHNATRIKKDVDKFSQHTETLSTGNVVWLDWPWKLHRRTDGTVYELYNLETDPNEQLDRAGDPVYAQRLSDMKEALHNWQTTMIRSLNGADYGQTPAWLPMNQEEGLEVFNTKGLMRGELLNMANSTSHWVMGRHSRGVILDGVDDKLSIPYEKLQPAVGSNARTVVAWIRTTGMGREVKWGDTAVAGGLWDIEINSAGRLNLDVFEGSITGTSDLRDGSWHHIAVVLPHEIAKPSVTNALFYIDGTNETISASVSRVVKTSNSKIIMGGLRNSALVVDEFRYFPRALNPEEIMTLYSASNQTAAAWHYSHYGEMETINWFADTEPDGLNDLQEYAFGHNPRAVDGEERPLVSLYNPSTRRFEVSFARRRDGTHDLTYVVQVSDDLQTWELPFSVKSIAPHPELDDGGFDWVTIESDSTIDENDALFVRVQAILENG